MTHNEWIESRRLFRETPFTAKLRQAIWNHLKENPAAPVSANEMGQLLKAKPSVITDCFRSLCIHGFAKREADIEVATPTKKDLLKTKTFAQISYVEAWGKKTEKKW